MNPYAGVRTTITSSLALGREANCALLFFDAIAFPIDPNSQYWANAQTGKSYRVTLLLGNKLP